VEGELGGAADHPQRLAGVVHAGQLHDHPAVPGALQGGLGDAELVDPAAQHLHRPAQRVRVHPLAGGVLGFEDDLRAATQVEAEPGGPVDGQPARRAQQGNDGEQAPSKMT
jgi:hypothetical protein